MSDPIDDLAGPADLAGLATEGRRPELADLDLRPTVDLVRLMLDEQRAVDAALEGAADALARAVDAVAGRLGAGGRLLYLGAGTPGRLAALDAAELPPTFGIAPDRVVALLAGGTDALAGAREGQEDDGAAAATALRWAAAGPDDAVVGISASGRTPYVVEGLRAARALGAVTVSIANNSGALASSAADIAIELPTGAEVIAGSTRLKAGTAQKVVLSLLSTLVMVRLGRTYGDLMVDLRAGNVKLRDRARRIVVDATGATPDAARTALEAADGETKVAVVMVLAGVDASAARVRLARDGNVRGALG
jgi:N-acetylmuramic acid 6-phosphate etherase